MRKVVAIGMMIALSGAGTFGSLAAQSPAGAVMGKAQGPNLQALPRVRVQLRNTDTGDLVGSTTSTEAGEFSFAGLAPANYVVEVADESGKILGIGTPFSLPAGTTATASVLSLAPGGIGTASSGLSLFGMGHVTSLAVLGAASAASITAVVATRPDASPSR
jgi:hypothetical protein